MSDEIYYRSATELEAEILARNLSPVDLTKAVLARIDAVNPGVNAFCTVVPERALDDARHAERQLLRPTGEAGPLLGIPISFKDLTMTAGIRTTFGSKIFEHHVPGRMPWWWSGFAGPGRSCWARRIPRSSVSRE